MEPRIAFVTGAGGEMGRLLIPELASRGYQVAALDLHPLDEAVREHCIETVVADVCDGHAVSSVIGRHRPTDVFHLAAVLSAGAERDPNVAHRVNVEGTLQLYRMCGAAGVARQRVRFLFPSSIAVYGLLDADTKRAQGAVAEHEWTLPTGFYGANKLYDELVGRMLSRPRGDAPASIDFRAIRFPGLISADTLPSGGTTDFAPEMVHAAARGDEYRCFVAEHTQLPFMTMPDAVDALIRLAGADEADVRSRVYNIQGFAATAGELRDAVVDAFPGARIGFDPDAAKQALVDTWPGSLDDSAARTEWGLAPRHGLREAVDDYLAPRLRDRYGATTA